MTKSPSPKNIRQSTVELSFSSNIFHGERCLSETGNDNSMQLLGWWRAHESSTTSLLRCSATFIGCQFARGLSTSSPWQYTNACMDWRQLTWSTTVMQFPLSPASDIFGLQTLGHYSCQGRRQHWGRGVLRSPAHASGTVCQLPFEPQCSRLWRSPDISRATYLIDWQRLWGLFRTRFTNLRIIIIIIDTVIVCAVS